MRLRKQLAATRNIIPKTFRVASELPQFKISYRLLVLPNWNLSDIAYLGDDTITNDNFFITYPYFTLTTFTSHWVIIFTVGVTVTRILRSAVTIFRATRIPLVAVIVGAAGASLSALAQQCQWDTLILTINASYRTALYSNPHCDKQKQYQGPRNGDGVLHLDAFLLLEGLKTLTFPLLPFLKAFSRSLY